jgi:RIO kinase 3
LQQEFDVEYQQQPHITAKQVPITIVDSDTDNDDGIEDPDEQRDYIRRVERAINVGARGYTTVNGQIITKHDPDLCGHRNTQKVTDNLPASFPCGDAHTSNQPISNRIYNQLRKSALKDEKRSRRQGEAKEKSTAEKAIDENTRILLQKMINSELVESYGGIVAAGKEAIVIHATGGSAELDDFQGQVPNEMAVKVFKTTLNEFKSREKYIQEDYRFKGIVMTHNL